MNLDYTILIGTWILMGILLWIFTPREKILHVHVGFLCMQVITWVLGALVVENKLISYPVRFLDYTYRASFSFEYFLFPSISALFNVHFPEEKSLVWKILYACAFPTAITSIEAMLEKYTNLIKYINWTWYYSWISLLVVLLLSYWYYRWFFRKIEQIYGKKRP